MHTSMRAIWLATATAMGGLAAPSLGLAQDAAAIEEVVVTAQKRSENVQDIPIAIDAFSGERLRDSGVANIEDVQFLSAGLNFGHDREGSLRTSIRGISSNVGLESAAAVHIDGVYISNRFDQANTFYDLERVEVLRGPQGTLYGRNATGGAINLITRGPTSESEAGGQVTVGNYDLVETEGYLSGPLTDTLGARVAFKTSNLAGYGRNLTTNQDINGADSVAVRGVLRADPTGDVQVRLTADYARVKANGDDDVTRLFPSQPLSAELAGFSYAHGYDSTANRPDQQDTKTFGTALRLQWSTDALTVTSLTGYRQVKRGNTIDIDGSADERAYFKVNEFENRQYSQELNIASAGEGPVQWLVGGFYYRNNYKTRRQVTLNLFGANLFSGSAYDTEAWAIYGEGSYAFSERAKLTIGGRYSKETNRDRESELFVGFTSFDVKQSSDAFTPKVSFAYEFAPDINGYVTYSEGFKSGGFNPSVVDPNGFDPERVKNYEIGLKTRLFDRRLQANAAVFQMDYSDLQVNTLILQNGIPAVRVVNAAEATIKGVELDLQARPTQALSIDGNLSYLDATYDRFLAADNITFTSVDVAGNRMVGSPKFAANLGVVYHFTAGDWDGALRGEYSHASRIYYTPFEDLRGVSQKPYGLFNARLQLDNPDRGWSVAIWGRNLTDERVASYQAEANDTPFTGLFKSTTYQPPRTFGITVGKDF